MKCKFQNAVLTLTCPPVFAFQTPEMYISTSRNVHFTNQKNVNFDNPQNDFCVISNYLSDIYVFKKSELAKMCKTWI